MNKRATTMFVLFLVGLAGAFPARAEPEGHARGDSSEERRRAREAFEHGLELLDAGDLPGAAADFERSLEIRDSLPVLYNLAVCYQRLERFKAARDKVERLLALAESTSTPEDALERARALLEATGAQLARIDLEVQGSPREVLLDGERIGEGDFTTQLELDPGHHELQARRKGAELLSQDFDVEPGATRRVVLDATVRPTSGQLVVTIQPEEGEISLDGELVGRGRVTRSLAPGRHQLEVAAPEHIPVRRDLLVKAGEMQSLAVSLEPAPPAVTETWWFWTSVGAVAIAAGTAIAIVAANRDPYDGGSLGKTLFGPGR